MKCKCCNQEIINNIQEIPAKRLEWGKMSDEEMDWNEAVKWCKAQGEEVWYITEIGAILCGSYQNTPVWFARKDFLGVFKTYEECEAKLLAVKNIK